MMDRTDRRPSDEIPKIENLADAKTERGRAPDGQTKRGQAPQPSNLHDTTFHVVCGPNPSKTQQILAGLGLLKPQSKGPAQYQVMKLDLASQILRASQVAVLLNRQDYEPNFFEERILPGTIKLPPSPHVDYQFEVHPIHAYALESSKIRPIIQERFPQIADPVIQSLVAGLLVSSSSAPSIQQFNQCFQRPLANVTQEDINTTYQAVQSARINRAAILRNCLATRDSTVKRSQWEILQTSDTVYDPWKDSSDRFNVQYVIEQGITLTVRKEVLEAGLAKSVSTAGTCPHAEKLKLEKLFQVEVAGKSLSHASKVALSIHDTFDHMFFFDVIHKIGIADALLPAIGNFNFSTRDNIFSIPSEYLAMVAYDWRAWQEMGAENNRPMTQIVDAARDTLRRGLESGKIPDKVAPAIRDFLELSEDEELVRQFGFVLRGIFWENGEMSIKWGSLDLKPFATVSDPLHEPWGPTPILEHPAYLAFVLCGLKALNDPCNEALAALRRINNTLEYHVSEAIRHYQNSSEPYTFNLKIRNLREISDPGVSPEVREWFQEHVGFAAVRTALCE